MRMKSGERKVQLNFRKLLLGWINTQLATPHEKVWIALRETRNIEKAVGEVSMENSKLATPSSPPVARLTTPRGKIRRIFRWGCVKSRLFMRAHTTFQRRVEGGKVTMVGRVGYNVKFTVVFPRLSTERSRFVRGVESFESTGSYHDQHPKPPSIHLPSSDSSTNPWKRNRNLNSELLSWCRDARSSCCKHYLSSRCSRLALNVFKFVNSVANRFVDLVYRTRLIDLTFEDKGWMWLSGEKWKIDSFLQRIHLICLWLESGGIEEKETRYWSGTCTQFINNKNNSQATKKTATTANGREDFNAEK